MQLRATGKRYFTQKAKLMLRLFRIKFFPAVIARIIATVMATVLVISSGLHATAQAALVDDLYVGLASVADRSAAERVPAMRRALAYVLIRVTGDADIASRQAAQPILQQPSNYLRSHSYLDSPASDGSNSSTPQPQTWILRAQFEPATVEAALKKHGITQWSPQRPQTVIWLARAMENDPILLNSEQTAYSIVGADAVPNSLDANLQQHLHRAAIQRGLPIALPKMDVEDSLNINAYDLSTGYLNNLPVASKRYAADFMLVGILQQPVRPSETDTTQTGWPINWQLFDRSGNLQNTWSTSLNDKNLPRGLSQHITDKLTKHYLQHFNTTVVNSASPEPDRVVLVIEGIRSATQLASVTSFLKQLDGVQRHQMLTAQDDTVEFQIMLNKTSGSFAQFKRILALQQQLSPTSSPYSLSEQPYSSDVLPEKSDPTAAPNDPDESADAAPAPLVARLYYAYIP